MFVDANGMPVTEGELQSDATFSNIHPDTSEADALGGNSTRVIWGTNISIQDSMSAFKNFLYNFARKYRMWADGATEMETSMMPTADEREYISMLNTMRQLGVTSLNLDAKNLKAYPSTRKLWHQLQAYPQEIIPLMDQTVKDVMVELATKEMERLRAQSFRHHAHANNPSSTPVNPSSDAMSDAGRIPQQAEIPDLVAEVETKNFKVLPFGLDHSVNMRDLDPAGQLCPQKSHRLFSSRANPDYRYGQVGQHQGFGHSHYSDHSRYERGFVRPRTLGRRWQPR